MTNNLEVYEKVRAVPPAAIKPINGGRLKGMSDINPMWRLKMLTEVFGLCGVGWKIEIKDRRLEKGSGDEIVCFVDINLYVKVDGQWSEPIPGMGGSSFVTVENSGRLYTSDECFKMAYTDAISVACKSLGFAADVYFANDRTKHTQPEDTQTPPNAAPNLTVVPPQPNSNLVSEGQMKLLRSKASIAGYKKKDAADLIEALGILLKRKITDISEIKKAEVDTVVDWFNKQAQQPVGV